MITSFDISQELFSIAIYIDSFKMLFEASSQACSAILTTIWPDQALVLTVNLFETDQNGLLCVVLEISPCQSVCLS